MSWRREKLPTPVLGPREFHGLYTPWSHKESDTTERLSLSAWKNHTFNQFSFFFFFFKSVFICHIFLISQKFYSLLVVIRITILKPTLYNTLLFFLFLFFICSGFCHTLKWNSHGFTCVPHPDPPSHLPLHPLPLGFPIAPGPSACLMHPTWAGDPLHPR